MEIREFIFGTPTYDESIRLRTDILRTPLGLDFSPEDLADEYTIYHLGAFSAIGELLGCLVIEPLGDNIFKMRQVTVAENRQGQGIGQAMVKASEDFIQSHGGVKMTLNARETAVPFYLNLNYKKVGDRFIEVKVPHFKMEKVLS